MYISVFLTCSLLIKPEFFYDFAGFLDITFLYSTAVNFFLMSVLMNKTRHLRFRTVFLLLGCANFRKTKNIMVHWCSMSFTGISEIEFIQPNIHNCTRWTDRFNGKSILKECYRRWWQFKIWWRTTWVVH